MLKQRTIFWFWLPLAFSFLLMIFEGPWIQGIISRQDDAAVQLAAFGLVIGMAVLIETPVITFLAVGSALAQDRQSYHVLSRYVLTVNILLTIVSALLAFTPLLDFYLGTVLDIPQHLIDASRPAMRILVFWTWFIGYRRLHQGILINSNRTQTITVGTFLRLVASVGIAFGLGAWGQLSGVVIAAWSLMGSVTVEMIYVHIISRPDVARLKSKPSVEGGRAPLSIQHVMRFHFPLAITSIMSWLVLPLTQRALAQADNAVDVLAAYPVIFSIMMIMRSGGIAWQEAVIALNRGEAERQALQTFTRSLGLGTSLIFLLFSASPLITLYSRTVLGVPEHLVPLIVTGCLFATLLPLFSTMQSYLRALLMGQDDTNPIYQAMGIGFTITVGSLFGGIWLGLAAIPVAITALTVGMAMELAFLRWRLGELTPVLIPFYARES
ncbi:MAG: hypothetical protein AAF125_02385 [Chloroflexota bacterium]